MTTKTIPEYLEDERQKEKETLSYVEKKKLIASSFWNMATIALWNSPSWNCNLRLRRLPKRERLRKHLGKNQPPREKRRRTRQGA